MVYIENITYQLRTFFYSLGIGVLLCIIYDFFRFFRNLFSFGKILTFIEDVLFAALSACVTFVFLLAINNGKVCWYIFLGEFLGFAVYYFTLGEIGMKIYGAISKKAKRVLKKIKLLNTRIMSKNRVAFIKKEFKNKKVSRNVK